MTDLASTFRALHRSESPLVLVNAWDVASARIVAAAGAPAVATTSAGVAWSLGAADGGDALGRTLAVDLVRRVVAAVDVPVTADIESGFGATPAEVGETVRAVAEAGAVGVNLEDAMRPADEQAPRYAAAREAAPGLFINARIDTYLRGPGGVEDTVARAKIYLDAGVDGIFVPGVGDLGEIAELVRAIPAPVNVLVGAGSPTVAELSAAGVARISLGSSVAEAAYGVAHRAAVEAYATGTYESVRGGMAYGEINELYSKKPSA